MARFGGTIMRGLAGALGGYNQGMEEEALRRQREEELELRRQQQEMAQKAAEQSMATARMDAILKAQAAGYRKPSQVNSAIQQAGAPSGMAMGGVALPNNIGEIAQIASSRGQMLNVPGAGQMELNASLTPDAKDEARDFRNYTRTTADRRADLNTVRADRASERKVDQAFDLQRDNLKYQRDLALAGQRGAMQSGPKLPASAINQLGAYDAIMGMGLDVKNALEGASKRNVNITGRIGGAIPTASWMKNLVNMGGDEGTDIRGLMGNLYATLAKERGGTALSANEIRLLESYIPNENEDEKKAILKANRFVREIDRLKKAKLAALTKYGRFNFDDAVDPEERSGGTHPENPFR